MDKIAATNIIKKSLKIDTLNPNNGGNVKFSNINKSKNVFWLNVHIDDRLSEEYHLILNDDNEKKFIYIQLPPNTLNKELFKMRFDNTNNKDKLDLEISNENISYLIDIKSGGTKFNFNQFVIKIFEY